MRYGERMEAGWLIVRLDPSRNATHENRTATVFMTDFKYRLFTYGKGTINGILSESVIDAILQNNFKPLSFHFS